MSEQLSKVNLCDRPVFISEGAVEKNIIFEDTTEGLYELTKDLLGAPGPCYFNPILVGGTGVGKTTMIRKLSEALNKPLYTIVGNDEISPEDLLISASLNNDGKFDNIASPLGSAMLTGGICFIDELGKLRERSMAVLASILDKRREALSSFLGCTIKAHPEFRFIAATNTSDLDKFDLPDWMKTRLLPYIQYPNPNFEQIQKILEANLKQSLNDNQESKLKSMVNTLHSGGNLVSPGVIVRCWELYTYFLEKHPDENRAQEKAIQYVNWNNHSLS